jgi:2-C-methyl-D-erythritol 4-phosphate cytidylyltransferase
MNKYAIIAAAGSGVRMGLAEPKQFLLLQGKPILWHTLNVFLNTFGDLKILLVLPEEFMAAGKRIVHSTSAPERIVLVVGGKTRFHSVSNGLQQIDGEGVVFVQDGVRCLVTGDLIHRCYAATLEKGNAVPAIFSVDSLRMEQNGKFAILDRRKVRIIQTPQTFYSQLLKSAFRQPYQESWTDEASVVEKSGIEINLIEGEEMNIKITRPVDLLLAELVLSERAAGEEKTGT